jgi:hypothetical protein
VSEVHGTSGSGKSSTTFSAKSFAKPSAKVQPRALPASANHERRGSSVSQPGTLSKRLADARNNSSF